MPEHAHARRRRYRPPTDVRSVAVRELLRGSPRETLDEPKQLDLLTTLAGKSGTREATLFVAGDPSLLQRRCISVIGTRQVSDEGASRARRLARELTRHGVVVVSGLAEGVDTHAMTAAIDEGGRTIGVIGTPMDKAYPAANGPLQEEVYTDHLLVSQFQPGFRTFPSNFPERNKTMALLSDASVVIEASDTSGTLHQAAECVKLGRWLCIAQSVVEDQRLTWPAKFLSYDRCVILETTEQLLATIYGRP